MYFLINNQRSENVFLGLITKKGKQGHWTRYWDNGFKKEPLKLKTFSRDQNFFRPSNFTLIQGNPVRFAVAMGATVREAMLFELKIENGILL